MSDDEKPRMSPQAQVVEPAEVIAEDPESLYTGRPNYWAKRQQQSGMERKHELWVMETLNFLQHLDIPFYTRDERGDRIPQKDKEIPERLKMALEKFWEQAKEIRLKTERIWDIERRLRESEERERALHEALCMAAEFALPEIRRGPGAEEHLKAAKELYGFMPYGSDLREQYELLIEEWEREDDGKSQPV